MMLALLMTCQLAFCQTPTDVFNQFKEKKGVEYNEIPKIMLSLVTESMDDAATKEMMNRLQCMKMMSISNANAETRANFIAAVKKLDGKYTKVNESSEDGETIIIYIEGTADDVKSMIMADVAEESCDFIVLEGKLKASDLTTFSNMQGD